MNGPWFKTCGVALSLCACMAASHAQQRWAGLQDTVFQHWGRDQGLPNGGITALAEDGQGFVWVGIQGALARWDGYRFRIYRAGPPDSGALADGNIQTLHTDAQGRLWIGTISAGLARYDPALDQFVSYPAGPQGLSHVLVRSVADDGQGGVWVGTGGGLDHVMGDSAQIQHFRHDANDPSSLPADMVYALLRDRSGALWVGTARGLVRRNPDGSGFTRFTLPTGNAAPPRIASLLQASDGRIWIGTSGQSAYVLEPGTGRIQAVRDAGKLRALGDATVNTLSEAKPGEIWLGTDAKGVLVADADGRQLRQISHVPAQANSLPDSRIIAFLNDSAGHTWVGSDAKLSRHSPQQETLLSISGSADANHGISAGTVLSILDAGDGKLWLGLNKNGVDIFDPALGRTGALRPDPAHPGTGLPDQSVTAFARSKDGTVLIGTDRGLYQSDAPARTVHQLSLAPYDQAMRIKTLAILGNAVWVGSRTEGLISVMLRAAPGTARRIDTGALTDRRITILAPASATTMWVGTQNGLNLLDANHAVLEKILPATTDAGALASGNISALLTDARGRLWVGTYGGGVAVMEGRDRAGRPQFRRIGVAQGLPSGTIDHLLSDRTGHIWASTQEGLAQIDPDRYAVRTFQRADGLAIPTHSAACGVALAQGELVFCGPGGLTVVRPDRQLPWTYRPPIVVTEAYTGRQAVPAGRLQSGTPLVVQANANSLSVEFSALDYSAPELNRYAYRLQGFDPEWITTESNRRVAAYTNLPPGAYTLRLRGSNRAGVWTERELAVSVQVLPAWWQTWWARMAAALALCASIYAMYRWRTRQLHQRQLELEVKVKERTASLEAVSAALSEASLTDPLTGLRNRRFLAEQIETDVAMTLRAYQDASTAGQSAPESGDLLFFLVDIDHFKQVNDEYGHAAGDAVLSQMRVRLESVFRESDYLVRWGGEEFLIVARGTGRAHAPGLAERVRANVANEAFLIPGELRLTKTCSIGYACFPLAPDCPHVLDWHTLVAVADAALYEVKHNGRNGWLGVLRATTANEVLLRALPSQSIDAWRNTQVVDMAGSAGVSCK